MEMNKFDCRVSFNSRMMKKDYDLFKDKCDTLGLSYSKVLRLLIEEFNDTYWLVIE